MPSPYEHLTIVTSPLIKLQNCDVFLNSQPILHDISWQLQANENWAFVGANGSGKSTLLQLIRGAIWPHFARGSRFYRFDNRETTSPIRAREQIAFVSGAQQQKYRRQEWTLSGRELLLSGFFDSELLHQKPTNEQCENIEKLARELGLTALLERDYQTLSHGELRRLLIARALVKSPRVLVLDEACSGLDANARAQMLQFIGQLASREVQLLMATHRRDEIVSSISHVVHLENGHIISQGRKNEVLTPPKQSIRPKARLKHWSKSKTLTCFATTITFYTTSTGRGKVASIGVCVAQTEVENRRFSKWSRAICGRRLVAKYRVSMVSSSTTSGR